MKLPKLMKAAQHRVCGGSEFLWKCFGPNARWMEFSDHEDREFADAVYDTQTNQVYQINVYVPGVDDRCVTWVDPEFEHTYVTESRERGLNPYQAWDNVMYSTIPGSEENMVLDLIHDASDGTYNHFPSAKYTAKYTDEQTGDRAVVSEHVGADDILDDIFVLPDTSKSYVAQFTVLYTVVVEADSLAMAATKARDEVEALATNAPAFAAVEVIKENIGTA